MEPTPKSPPNPAAAHPALNAPPAKGPPDSPAEPATALPDTDSRPEAAPTPAPASPDQRSADSPQADSPAEAPADPAAVDAAPDTRGDTDPGASNTTDPQPLGRPVALPACFSVKIMLSKRKQSAALAVPRGAPQAAPSRKS